MRQCKNECPGGHEHGTETKPARLRTYSSEVTDRNAAQHTGDVVGAGNEARLLAVHLEALFDGWKTDVDHAVDEHALAKHEHADDCQCALDGSTLNETWGLQLPPFARDVRFIFILWKKDEDNLAQQKQDR